MKPTAHTWIALAILIISLGVSIGPLLSHHDSYSVEQKELTIDTAPYTAGQITVAQVLHPIEPAYTNSISQNPFAKPQAKKQGLERVRLPPPPPPTFLLPDLPILPMPEKE